MTPTSANPTTTARLRERIDVEYTLAHVSRWQGRRGIEVCARTFLICVVVPSFTMYTFSLAHSNSQRSQERLPDFSTGSLAVCIYLARIPSFTYARFPPRCYLPPLLVQSSTLPKP